MAARAPLVTPRPRTVTARSMLPERMTLARVTDRGRMSARVAMLLRLIEARVEQDVYYEMLKELLRFIEVEMRDVEAAQILAWEDAVLGKLTRQGSDQTPTK